MAGIAPPPPLGPMQHQKLFNDSADPRDPTTTNPKTNEAGQTLADPSMKWGVSRHYKSKSKSEKETDEQPPPPDFSTYYTPEEQERLRAKGVNPELKAEMEWSKKRSEGKGFWRKLAGTALGGGWIK